MSRWLVAILAIAAILRLFRLDSLPPGLQFDEAHNALDALRILGGARDVFFTENGGREPLAVYLEALAFLIVGENRAMLAVRLVSAVAGLGTVALVYAFIRSFLRDGRIAIAAAGFLALSYWHLHFSRYGIRAIFAPFWTTLAVWSWWLLTRKASTPSARLRAAVVCGIALAGGVYSHPTGRLLPLILGGHGLWIAWRDRGRLRELWGGALVAAGVSIALFLPLARFFLAHPVWFFSHPGDVSLAAVAARDFDGSMARALAHQLLAVGGMFFIAGDPSAFHNLPCLPVFDPLSAVLAVCGVGLGLAALVEGLGGWRRSPNRGDRGEKAVVLALWLGVMLLPTLLSDRPPNYSRAIAALPVIVLLPAAGLAWWHRQLGHRLGFGAMLGITLGIAGLWTTGAYFEVFAKRTPEVCGTDRKLDLYRSYDLDKRDAYAWLKAQADAGATVFLHPLWFEHASFRYLNREGPVRRLDPVDTVVLPAGASEVVIAAPAREAEEEGWLEPLEADGFVGESHDDPQGRPLLTVMSLASGSAPAWPGGGPSHRLAPKIDLRAEFGAEFGEAIQLWGYRLEGDPRAGEPLPIRLYWRAGDSLDQDWTAFAQLVGPDGEGLGQDDRRPGDGSFPTTDWRAGDRVVQRLRPTLGDAYREGRPLLLRIGWYRADTGERLPVTVDGLEEDARLIDDGTALEVVIVEGDSG